MSVLIQADSTDLTGTQYPVLNCLVKRKGLWHPWQYVTAACFHDLFDSYDGLNGWHTGELAGMGLAITGNLMRMIGRGELGSQDEARLELLLAKGAEPIRCPWPGMPNDQDLLLDFEQLPWDSTMFLGERGDLKRRMNRLRLMWRIEKIWTPWLIGQLDAKL